MRICARPDTHRLEVPSQEIRRRNRRWARSKWKWRYFPTVAERRCTSILTPWKDTRLEGSFEVNVGGIWETAGVGERVVVEKRVVHTFRNSGDQTVGSTTFTGPHSIWRAIFDGFTGWPIEV